jgi:hypothetical protein
MNPRALVATAAAWLAWLAGVWTLAIVLIGGIRFQLGPVLLSSRDWHRASALTAIAFACSFLLAPPGNRSLAWQRLREWIERHASKAAFVAAAAVFWVTFTYGARAAAGADTFGYVSYAYLWLNGSLEVPQPLAGEVPWPDAAESLAPLGYRPGVTPATMVPTYSPGLPLIMAALHLVFGWCGPYLVQPIFGPLLVLATAGISIRLAGDRLTSALAALFMASSPALLFNLMSPMSDTATAALWVSSLLVLTWPGRAAAALAGVIAGVAVLVRPNLVPLTLAGMLAAELWPVDSRGSRRCVRAALFLAGVIPAALFVAFVNDGLYGSPLLSGYGRAGLLYGLQWIPGNLRNYPVWLFESQGPVIVLAVLPLLVPRLRPAWLTARVAIPVAVTVAIVCASYMVYMQFRDWWYLRFVLTAFPFLFILLGAALAALFRAAPAPVSVPALTIVLVLALNHTLGFIIRLGALRVGEGEERYTAVARFIDRELPPNAVVLSMQHSGTIRFYSGRMTIRYEYIPEYRFKASLDWLMERGYRPFILLEEWEVPRWRDHFVGDARVASLDFRVLGELQWPANIRLFDPLEPRGKPELVRQMTVPPAPECVQPRGWK